MALVQAENTVKIEGILSEVDVNNITFKKKDASGVSHDTEALSGVIKVRVEGVKIGGVEKTLEVPVHVFASKFKNNGQANPAYENIDTCVQKFKSIAAVGYDEADAVRITGASITMNEFYPQGSETLVSQPRISASFITKITDKSQMKPEASFAATFVVANGAYEVDADGVETGRYKITGILPQYGGKVDKVTFVAVDQGVITAVSSYWQPNETVKAVGKLNFSSTTVKEMVEVDFGEPQERIRTVSVSELVITGGAQTPLTGEQAYDIDEINEALAQRKAALLARKAASETQAPKAPAQGKATISTLGF